MDRGATPNTKDNERQSALHFAAKYGRYQTCMKLLSSGSGIVLINEVNEYGKTSLHLAAEMGNVRIVQLLLKHGALLHRCHLARSPLHYAALNGYTQTMRVLLAVHAHLIDQADKEGNTALHLAALHNHANAINLLLAHDCKLINNNNLATALDIAVSEKNSEAAIAMVKHERWREFMELRSFEYGNGSVGLIKNLPHVFKIALDQCYNIAQTDFKSVDFYSEYDFSFLQGPMNVKAIPVRHRAGIEYMDEKTAIMPLSSLNFMVMFNRVDLLSHPVCKAYLQMKWNTYGMYVNFLNLGLYVMFLTFLTSFMLRRKDLELEQSVPKLRVDRPYAIFNDSLVWLTDFEGNMWPKNENFTPWYSNEDYVTSGNSYGEAGCEDYESEDFSLPNPAANRYDKVIIIMLAIYCCLSVIKEFTQIFQQGIKYFMEIINVTEWMCYMASLILILPLFPNYQWYNYCLQWQAGSVAIFLAWFNLLLYLQRFDLFGIYVVMFIEILRTLLQVLIVFSILIVAFGLTFYVLLGHLGDKANMTPIIAIMRSTVMMLGEITFVDYFVIPWDNHRLPSAELTMFFLMIYILLMPILLMNLLIGLAVGDIEGVKANASLKRIAMQVEMFTELEKKMPNSLKKRWNKTQIRVYPNKHRFVLMKVYQMVASDNVIDNSMTSAAIKEEMYKRHQEGEMDKQKNRIKSVSTQLEKQTEMVKLILQKMEIRSEADNVDEGAGDGDDDMYITGSKV